MKKQLIFTMLLLATFLSGFAQENGIKFENSLTWAQVKAKARAEKKYIFIDFMATWCAPCKAMDNQVYNQKEVGDVLNADFISLKLQEDQTAGDSEYVKSWYADAAQLFKKYEVTAFPTLVFLSPSGEFLHLGKGFYSPREFLSLVGEAKDPSRQYVLLNSLKDLLSKAKKAKAFDLEKAMAKDYINNFMSKLTTEQLYTKSNLLFFADYVEASDRVALKVFYPDATRAKAVLGDAPVLAAISRIITNDVIKLGISAKMASRSAFKLSPHFALK